jgi:hypothetical protein
MAQPIESMTLAELTAENKGLQRKKNEVLERQALISKAVGERAIARKSEAKIMGMTDEEIDALESAVKRARLRRQAEKASG